MYLYRIRFTGEGFSNLCCLLLVLIIKSFYVQKSLFIIALNFIFQLSVSPLNFLQILLTFFDCLEYPVSLSSFRHLDMFVRLCGFFLLPEDFSFTYLTTPIQSLPLYRAPFPLTWEH